MLSSSFWHFRIRPGTQAVKHVHDQLLAEGKEGAASIVDALDLVNLLKKADAAAFDCPADVLVAIRTAWQTITTADKCAAASIKERGITDRTADTSATPPTAALAENDLADALVLVQQCWHEESLEGCPLDEDDFAMHAMVVNYKAVKSALGHMVNWSQRSKWDGFVPALKVIKEDAGKKAQGPYRTYAQVIASLRGLIAAAKRALREELSNNAGGGRWGATGGGAVALASKREEVAMEVEVDEGQKELLEEHFSNMERWIWEKWEESDLPPPQTVAGVFGGSGKLSPTRRSSVGGKGIRNVSGSGGGGGLGGGVGVGGGGGGGAGSGGGGGRGGSSGGDGEGVVGSDGGGGGSGRSAGGGVGGVGPKRVRDVMRDDEEDFKKDESNEDDEAQVPLSKKVKKEKKGKASAKKAAMDSMAEVGKGTPAVKAVVAAVAAAVAANGKGGGVGGGSGAGVGIMGLPPGSTVSPTVPDAVVVKVVCHGLQATALMIRPKLLVEHGHTLGVLSTGGDSSNRNSAGCAIDVPSFNGGDSGNGGGGGGTGERKAPSAPHPVVAWMQGKGERCARNDSKTWRCRMAAVPGLAFCPDHRQEEASPSGSGGGSDPTDEASKQQHGVATRVDSLQQQQQLSGGDGVGTGGGAGGARCGGEPSGGEGATRYPGLPMELRIIAVAGVLVNAAAGDVLASPAAFEVGQL
jgi:hypothetical protein